MTDGSERRGGPWIGLLAALIAALKASPKQGRQKRSALLGPLRGAVIAL